MPVLSKVAFSSFLKKAISAYAVAFAVIFSGSAWAADYQISYDPATDTAHVSSPTFGSWDAKRNAYSFLLISTPPGTPQPPGTNTHRMTFEIQTNYFDFPSGGHLAMFLRADPFTKTGRDPSYPYRGHGITLGNLSGYPTFLHPRYGFQCSGTARAATVAIEAAGNDPASTTSNCVFGKQTELDYSLDNGRYKVDLTSRYNFITNQYETTYSVYKWMNWVGYWAYLGQKSVIYQWSHVPSTLGGWFFAESFNTGSAWNIYLQVSEWWE